MNPTLTFDLVSLSDTQGGNMMQRCSAWTLSKHSLLSFLWSFKGSWKISSGYFSCGILLPCLACLQSQKALHPRVSHMTCVCLHRLDAITLVFNNPILVPNILFNTIRPTLMLFLILSFPNVLIIFARWHVLCIWYSSEHDSSGCHGSQSLLY